MNLRLQSTSQIAGTVYLPDGVSHAGANVVVNYTSDAFKVICSQDAIGQPSCVAPPFPGVTPPTTVVPYAAACFA